MRPSAVGFWGGIAADCRWVWSGLLLAAVSCGGAEPARSPTVSAAKAAQSPRTDRDRLRDHLNELPQPEAPLAALPPAATQELERQRAALTNEQRQLLLEGTDRVVATRPLLYLAVGGRDLSIISLLFSSAAGSNEIVGLLGDQPEYPGLVGAANEMARRAAVMTLKARAVDVARGVELDPTHLQQIALGGRLLDDYEIEHLALKLLLEGEQQGSEHDATARVSALEAARWNVALAQLEARSIKPESAEAHLEQAEAVLKAAPDPGENALDAAPDSAPFTRIDLQAAVAGARALIAAARPALGARKGATLDERVASARAALELGRPKRALAILREDDIVGADHLGYVTTLARAVTGGTTCPDVWPTLVNERLCRQAWAEALPRVSSSELDAAWTASKGRDVWAVESYLGFAFVVPLMYGLDRMGASVDPAAVGATLRHMQQVAVEARSVDEEFRGVALLARALGDAVSVALEHPGEPAAIAKDERAALLAEATTLATPDAKPWARSAALAVAAILTQHEATAPVLDALRVADLGAAKLTLGNLLLWDVLAEGNPARFVQYKAFLGDLAVSLDASAFERSAWLFAWAEAEAHLVPSDTSYANLERIASNLSLPQVPLELRLRAAIDRAGILARKGDFAAAAALLEPIVNQTPRSRVESHAQQELLVVATGYLIVVRGLQATSVERVDYAKQLQAFILDVTRANAAPPTLQMWLLMWGAEFDALLARDACRGRAACEQKIDRARGADRAKLSDAVGARVAALLSNGVLPVGGVQVEFRYQPSGHLVPDISVTPAFLLAHVPKVVTQAALRRN